MKRCNQSKTVIWAIVFFLFGSLGILTLESCQWNEITEEVDNREVDNSEEVDRADNQEEDYLVVEVTGKQSQWMFRYPGRDRKLGDKSYPSISKENPLGQLWEDRKNIDDFHTEELVLPVGRKIHLKINSQDVIHAVYMPYFRVNMEAAPGREMTSIFTPKFTTDEMRLRYREKEEWNEVDSNNLDKLRWETFEYDLACAKICGKGHFSMRTIVRVLSADEYDTWEDEQEEHSYYMKNIRNQVEDVFRGDELEFEELLKVKRRLKSLLKKLDQQLEITQKKRRTNKLNKARAKLEKLLNTVSESFYLKEVDAIIEEAENAVKDLLD